MRRLATIACLPLFAIASALWAGPAYAGADLTSEAGEADEDAPIVVTGDRSAEAEVHGTKTSTALFDTAQSVAVLGRERLDDQGVQGLGEVLRYVPGVTMGQGEGHRDQIVLRGQASTADFFLDGLRDDAQYYRPLYNTQQVEVLKGANALLFGRGGGGGVINRTSKLAQTGQTRLGGSASADSFGAWSLAGDLNLPLGERMALRINAAYEGLDNNRDQFGGHFLGIAPTIMIQPADGTRLMLAYEYAQDDRVIDRGVPSLGGRPITGHAQTFFGSPAINIGQVDAHIARVRLDQDLGPGLTFNVTGQYAAYDKHYANLLPGTATAAAVSFSGYEAGNHRSNWIGQANLVWKGTTGAIGHTVLIGAELSGQASDATRRNVLFANGSGGTASAVTLPLAQSYGFPAISWTGLVTNGHTDVTSRSLYIQDQIELAPWLQLIGGVRYDHVGIKAANLLTSTATSRSENKWSPRFGLVVKPQANIAVYASYARSFLPQSGDQFSSLDSSLQSLEPEAFRNLELGAKWQIMPAFSLTAAVFQLERSNTRVAHPAHPGFFVLTGKSRAKGLELSVGGRITAAWQISLGYTLQQGEIRSATTAAPAGRKLDKLPRHQASAWTRYDLTPRFGLGLGVVHQSGQFATISNAVWLPGFTRLDAAAYYDVSDRFSLQLNVENLTDQVYFSSAHSDNNIQPGDPINAKLTARLKF
ncbi:MAG: TonB-dependent siderophore receptor [Novosphingobium sp.]|uniref:TonB-dependent receptor n=1 Tax=Novosphingobium sp. TaxID=1874826 RepID=UPI0032BA5C79